MCSLRCKIYTWEYEIVILCKLENLKFNSSYFDEPTQWVRFRQKKNTQWVRLNLATLHNIYYSLLDMLVSLWSLYAYIHIIWEKRHIEILKKKKIHLEGILVGKAFCLKFP